MRKKVQYFLEKYDAIENRNEEIARFFFFDGR